MPTLEEERLALDATTDFRAAADIGLRVAALRPAPEGASALALLAFGKAELGGLTVHTDSDRYLAVKKEEAHIRFLDGDYAKAQNALSFFAAWQKDVPGWVRMYRCAINIQQLPQLYVQAPDMMFSELDAIEETDAENVSRRNANILAFFDKLVEWKNGGEVVEVQARPFLERAVRFGLGREDATRAFCDAFEPTFELPKEPKPSDPEWQHLLDELADVKEKLGAQKEPSSRFAPGTNGNPKRSKIGPSKINYCTSKILRSKRGTASSPTRTPTSGKPGQLPIPRRTRNGSKN